MKNLSPLRYPGGKAAMADLLSQIRICNGLGSQAMAEPFAGGAGASLLILYREETPEIHINDADPAIYDFWWSVVNRSKWFTEMLTKTCVSIKEWKKQRDVYKQGRRASRLRRGFSVFYLNRCNRSGIIRNGGPIGGIKQNGKWKINARFNKPELRSRCERIAEFRDRLRLTCFDGIEFLSSLDKESTFFFIDPPYFIKGKTLYLNALNETYHCKLAQKLESLRTSSWVLTYDDCPQIRKLYRGWATVRPFSLRYTAAIRQRGREILITPKWMRLPVSQASANIIW